jgi:hypothetical protein
MIMDSERFDGLVRTFGQTRSRRQTLRGLAGAGALLALLAAKPVAAGKAGKAGKPSAPHKAPKNPGNSQPGTGQNGPLGSGPNGQPGPSPNCSQCEEAYEGCVEPCGGEPTCLNRCQNKLDSCNAQCPNP